MMVGPVEEQETKSSFSFCVAGDRLVNLLVLEHNSFSALSSPSCEGEGSLFATILSTAEARGSQEEKTADSGCERNFLIKKGENC